MMKNRIFLIGLMVAWILSFALLSDSITQEDDQKLRQIITQIHILNLVNGLELDKGQMELIFNAAKEAQEIRLKTIEAISQKREVIQAHQEVLKVAKAGSIVVPREIAFRYHRIHQEEEKIKKLEQEKLLGLTLRVKNSLSPHQIYVLNDYQPCIIPPLKKGKIGQASDASGFVKVLEHIHHMPKEEYFLRRDRIVQEAIDKVKTRVPKGFILDEGRLKAQLLKAMEDVRGMPDVDFAMKKEKMAEDIKGQLLPEKPPVNIGVKIERFLLQPEIVPILEERLKVG